MRLARDEKGSTVILFAVSLAFILGFLTLSVDAGRTYIAKQQLQIAADAAALAGAKYLPQDPTEAQQVAVQTAEANGLQASQILTQVAGPTGNQLDVTTNETLPLIFGPFVGISQANVSAQAGAATGVLQSMTGLVPLSISDTPMTYGQTYTLKVGDGSGTNGDFGAVWFGDGHPGASTYESDLQEGTNIEISVGDTISTEPGNMVGPTDQGLSARLEGDSSGTPVNNSSSPRLIYVPIVSQPGCGRSDVTVVGFAAFWLESVNGGQVTGEFLHKVQIGTLSTASPTSTDLQGEQLVY